MHNWKDSLYAMILAVAVVLGIVAVQPWIPRTDFSRYEDLERVDAVGGERSGKWPAVMHAFRDLNPLCMFYGCKTPSHRLNVHHCIPFSWANKVGHPWLELCPENLITGCDDHHIHVFHAGNFQKFNLDVRHDAEVGRFNSRGISEWPGNEEMLRFLVWALGPPRETRPDVLPLVVTDPHKAWMDWNKTR